MKMWDLRSTLEMMIALVGFPFDHRGISKSMISLRMFRQCHVDMQISQRYTVDDQQEHILDLTFWNWCWCSLCLGEEK